MSKRPKSKFFVEGSSSSSDDENSSGEAKKNAEIFCGEILQTSCCNLATSVLSNQNEKKEVKPKEKKRKEDAKETPNEWQLDAKRKVTINEFRGKLLVDIREYYDADGTMKPGKKGISLSIDQWEKLLAAADEISKAVKKM